MEKNNSNEVEKILAKLVSFDTAKDFENEKIILWAGNLLKEKGFEVEYFKDENGKINLCAEYKVGEKVELYFSGHTDTVPIGENWTKNPLKIEKQGDKIFGLGTCDMKGGIAAFLSVFQKINLEELKKGIGVILTFDEEEGFSGIKYFLKNKKIEKSCVVIAEPTDLIPVAFTKGPLALQIKFFGKAAHGSCPEKGINAISMASLFIIYLEKYFQKEFSKKSKLFSSSASLNIAKISGGDAINKVPSLCILDLEIRAIEQKQFGEFIKLIKRIICEKNLKAEIISKLQLPPMISANQKFLNLAEEITGKEIEARSYATEGAFFSKSNSIIILGPGPNNAHIADEYVSAKSLQKAEKIYFEIIKKVCN